MVFVVWGMGGSLVRIGNSIDVVVFDLNDEFDIWADGSCNDDGCVKTGGIRCPIVNTPEMKKKMKRK